VLIRMSEKTIFECLKKAAPKDLSIEEVSKETGISRDTVSKPLRVGEGRSNRSKS